MNTALATSVTDRDLAAAWDADQRLAALVTFGSGVVAGVGVVFVLGMSLLPGGLSITATIDSDVVFATACMLAVDIAVLVFMVGLAHVVTSTRAFGEAVTIAVATLTTAIAATLHTVYGLTGSSADLPDWFTGHVAWMGSNIWLMVQYTPLIGACLLALSVALRSSEFPFARRLAGPYAAVGGLCVLAPVPIFTTCVAVPALFVLTLVRVGRLLWMTRTPRRHESDAPA